MCNGARKEGRGEPRRGRYIIDREWYQHMLSRGRQHSGQLRQPDTTYRVSNDRVRTADDQPPQVTSTSHTRSDSDQPTRDDHCSPTEITERIRSTDRSETGHNEGDGDGEHEADEDGMESVNLCEWRRGWRERGRRQHSRPDGDKKRKRKSQRRIESGMWGLGTACELSHTRSQRGVGHRPRGGESRSET